MTNGKTRTKTHINFIPKKYMNAQAPAKTRIEPKENISFIYNLNLVLQNITIATVFIILKCIVKQNPKNDPLTYIFS